MSIAPELRFDNFATGYKPNAIYTQARNVSARDWQNFRVTADGYLVPRAGSIRRNIVELAEIPETIIKAYYLV